jgi:aminoglycoside phosphotransferase (APT) family kinase protein
MRRSSREKGDLRAVLTHWLATKMPEGAKPEITSLSGTDTNGMSSETVLFDLRWTGDGVVRDEQLVARLAPVGTDVPVFRAYELDKQFEAMRIVGELSQVPVPRVRWYEGDPSLLGGTFFVMDRIEGVVPSDNPPYVFGGWLLDATDEQRRHLQDTTVAALAELHAIENATEHFGFLEYRNGGSTHLRRHIADRTEWYEFAAADVGKSPLIERCWAYLDEHLPHEGTPVLSWGDSRIGNMMFREFSPAAVFDWEMAGVAPREVDLGWLIYMHRTFQKMAEQYGVPGLPDFMRFEDVAATYESVSGYTPHDLEVYQLYAATQYGIVGMRTGLRSVHFGEAEMPDDIDDMLLNRADLESLLAEVSS